MKGSTFILRVAPASEAGQWVWLRKQANVLCLRYPGLYAGGITDTD